MTLKRTLLLARGSLSAFDLNQKHKMGKSKKNKKQEEVPLVEDPAPPSAPPMEEGTK